MDVWLDGQAIFKQSLNFFNKYTFVRLKFQCFSSAWKPWCASVLPIVLTDEHPKYFPLMHSIYLLHNKTDNVEYSLSIKIQIISVSLHAPWKKATIMWTSKAGQNMVF